MSGKRRVINDSDESDDAAKDGVNVESSPAATFDVKSQLKQRLEKTQARAAESKKRKLEQEREKQEAKKREEKPKEMIIPKKKTAKSADAAASTSATLSLLSVMKRNPGDSESNPKSIASVSGGTRSGSRTSSPLTRPPASTATTKYSYRQGQGHSTTFHGNNRPYQDRRSERTFEHMQPPRSSTPTMYQQQQQQQQPLRTSNEAKPPTPRNVKLEQMVWDSLDELCQSQCSEIASVPGALPSSAYSSSSRHGSSNQGIDMSASLIRNKRMQNALENEENLDFFDLDDQGCIIIQPTIPMFPEDFPADSKQKAWPLSWFGIVDPQVEQAEKSKQRAAATSSKAEASRRQKEVKKDPSSKREDDARNESWQSSSQGRRGSGSIGTGGGETIDRSRRSRSRSKEGNSWRSNERERFDRGRYSPRSRDMYIDVGMGRGRGRGRGRPPMAAQAIHSHDQPRWDGPPPRDEMRDGNVRGTRRGVPPQGGYRDAGNRSSPPRDHPGSYGPADSRRGPPPFDDSSRPPRRTNYPPSGGPDRDRDRDYRPRDMPYRGNDRGPPRGGNRRYNDRY